MNVMTDIEEMIATIQSETTIGRYVVRHFDVLRELVRDLTNQNREWKELYDFLLCEAEKYSESRYEWLNSFIEEYNNRTSCFHCGHKLFVTHDIWSTTGNYMLEVQKQCANCKTILETVDNRPFLRRQLETGNILVKDVETLTKELNDGN